MSVPEWTNPPSVYTPQAHYSQVARAGNTLYISGQLGLDASGELVGPGDAKAQARQAWRNLLAIIEHSSGHGRISVRSCSGESRTAAICLPGWNATCFRQVNR